MSRFSDFICSLSSGVEPSQQSYVAFLSKLRPALLRQVLWRGLWDKPPRFLGVVGSGWSDPEAREELLADFCAFMIRRLPGILKRCQEEFDIDYLVYINIRNFVHETQEKHDPVGSRIYRILISAVKRSIDSERLHLLSSSFETLPSRVIDEDFDREDDQRSREQTDKTIKYSSILGFTPQSDPLSVKGVDLVHRVEVWRTELLPDLVTAYQYTRVVQRLEGCISGLRNQGIEVFRFGDLLDCLRTQAREWLVSVQHASQGPSAPEDAGDEYPKLVPIVSPDTGIENRDFLHQLSRCVIAGIERREDRRTQEYLLKLWRCLYSWVAESAETEKNLGSRGLEGNKLPSAKKLGEILGIPRNRIPGLKDTLGRLVQGCQSALSGNVPVREREDELPASGLPLGSPSYAWQDGSIDMSRKSRLQRLRDQMGEAAGRFAQERARIKSQSRWPPRLGDIFLFAEAGAAPVEWLAVEQDPEDLRRLLVVAVDDNPLIGSRDVEVPPEAGASLGSIRCDLGVWLDGKTLDPELRTGVLALEHVSRVRHKRQAIEAGSSVGSLLEQEVDQDPEYLEWRETVAEALTGLQDRSPVAPARSPAASSYASSRWLPLGRPATVAASVLLVVGLGLGGMVTMQRAEITSLRQRLEEVLLPTPQLDLPFHHFTGIEPVRGPDQPLVVPAEARRIALIFEVTEPEPYSSYRLEIFEKNTEQTVWSDDRLTRVGSELSLDLPRSVFSTGSFVFMIYGLAGGEPELLETYDLAVVLE